MELHPYNLFTVPGGHLIRSHFLLPTWGAVQKYPVADGYVALVSRYVDFFDVSVAPDSGAAHIEPEVWIGPLGSGLLRGSGGGQPDAEDGDRPVDRRRALSATHVIVRRERKSALTIRDLHEAGHSRQISLGDIKRFLREHTRGGRRAADYVAVHNLDVAPSELELLRTLHFVHFIGGLRPFSQEPPAIGRHAHTLRYFAQPEETPERVVREAVDSFLGQSGAVQYIHFSRHGRTGKPVGFGFLELACDEALRRLVEKGSLVQDGVTLLFDREFHLH